MLKSRHHELVKIGEDASLQPYWKNNGKPNLFVFVVGETARAANFSVNGYNINKNPKNQTVLLPLISFIIIKIDTVNNKAFKTFKTITSILVIKTKNVSIIILLVQL